MLISLSSVLLLSSGKDMCCYIPTVADSDRETSCQPIIAGCALQSVRGNLLAQNDTPCYIHRMCVILYPVLYLGLVSICMCYKERLQLPKCWCSIRNPAVAYGIHEKPLTVLTTDNC
jgi:hypothetical protein